ncbi:hypothetical protein [Syntrophomonas curvata]
MKNTEIIKNLEAITALLQEMQQVSAQQVQLLGGNQLDLDLDMLEGLIAQRQVIMEEVDLLEAKLRRQWGIRDESKRLVLLDLETDADYHKYLGMIKAVILAINDNDLRYQDLLGKAKEQTQSKLNSLRNNQKAQKAYLQEDVYTEGWFIDKKK